MITVYSNQFYQPLLITDSLPVNDQVTTTIRYPGHNQQLVASELKKFNNDWSMNLSAALACNLLLSTFPVVVALLSILGLLLVFLGHDTTAFVTQVVTGALPKEV